MRGGVLWHELAGCESRQQPAKNVEGRKVTLYPFWLENFFNTLFGTRSRIVSLVFVYIQQACAMKYTIRVVGSLLGIAGVWYYWSHRKQVWNKENCDTVILSFLSIVIVIQFTIFIPFHIFTIFTHHPLLMPYSPLLYIPCRIKPYPQYLLSLKYP